MSSPKDQIKERLSIEDCISSYITIFPSGKNFKAKCPFHNEKTPSFFISPERNSYYCFGCNEKGDIFSFVEKFEGVDFRGALKILGAKTGIEVNSWQDDKKEDREILYEIMEKATQYFEDEFKKEENAKSYLLNRGLEESIISQFRVGYAPEAWKSVSVFLMSNGYKEKDLLQVGLIKKSEKNNGQSFYDRFRGRIMFPISDSSGRIIAFSGRLLDSNKKEDSVSQAKYINSTDSILFNKSNTLFGIDKAKLGIRSKGYSIIVEGQLDLLMSHQIGLDNTVAVSGTALASNTFDGASGVNNLGLVKRLSSKVIFAFDGDEAGMRATRRSALIAISLDMEVKIANLNDGRDPADIIKDDAEEWKNIIRNSKNIVSFEIDKMIQESDDLKVWGRKIREIVFPYLNTMKSSIDRSTYIKEIHYKSGIPEKALYADFEDYQKINLIKEEVVIKKEDKKISRISLLEKQFFSTIFLLENSKEGKDRAKKYQEDTRNCIGESEYKELFDNYNSAREALVLESERWYDSDMDLIDKSAQEIMLNFQEEILTRRAREKMIYIRKFEIEGDKEKSSQFLRDYQDLINKIQKIKNNRV